MGPLEGCYKIGRARDVDKRLDQLSILLPVELVVVHSIKSAETVWLESALHWAFSESRTRGEWFRLSAEDVALIRSITAADHDCDLPTAVIEARDAARQKKDAARPAERPIPISEPCPPCAELPDLLTVQQAAAVRKVAARTVREWIERGLASVRVPTGRGKPLHLIRRADLEAYAPKPRGAAKGNQYARKKM